MSCDCYLNFKAKSILPDLLSGKPYKSMHTDLFCPIFGFWLIHLCLTSTLAVFQLYCCVPALDLFEIKTGIIYFGRPRKSDIVIL